MDFVTVMGIAKRFREWNKGTGEDLPQWFMVVFVRLIDGQNDTLWQTAQRELLTWAEAHPERPALTAEQREVLVALDRLGMTHVALNETGNAMWATTIKPEWQGSWCCYGDSMSLKSMWCLRNLIQDATKPLDIAAMLKEAGV
jgi:hypothetical protein